MNVTRTRWAAIGAAVAVAVGAGGFGVGHATTSSGPMPIFVPLDAPCRLADTRPAPDTVGPRSTGIGPGEQIELDGWGDVGQCSLPTGTSALQLNVTAVAATAQTNLRFFPAGAAVPTAASLNPSPGAAPTPNAVTVGLRSTDGRFEVFNAFGTVAVVIDVIGIYDDHVHTGDDIVDGSLRAADLGDEPGLSFTDTTTAEAVGTTNEVVAAVEIRPPSSGFVTVHASAFWWTGVADRQIYCQITDGETDIVLTDVIAIDTQASALSLASQISLHRTFPVDVSSALNVILSRPFNLVCRASSGTVNIDDIHMTATFVPTSYGPIVLDAG